MTSSKRYDNRVYDTTLDSGCGLLRVLRTTESQTIPSPVVSSARSNEYVKCEGCGTLARGGHICEGAKKMRVIGF